MNIGDTYGTCAACDDQLGGEDVSPLEIADYIEAGEYVKAPARRAST